MSNIVKREEIEQGLVSIDNLKYQVEMVRQLMHSLMKEGVHYGKVPGSQQPTLLQPGADLLSAHFGINIVCSVDYEERTDTSYRVRIKAEAYKNDKLLGTAFGEASSDEEKYKWRRAVCDEEYELAPESERRIKFKMHYGKAEKIKQIRIPVADVSNTILKMAQKRAKVAVIRSVTASSDIFTQDIEDMPAEIIAGNDTPKDIAVKQYSQAQAQAQEQPQPGEENAFDIDTPQPQQTPCITEKQRKRLFAIAKSKGLSNDRIKEIVKGIAGVDHTEEIKMDVYDAIIQAIEQQQQ